MKKIFTGNKMVVTSAIAGLAVALLVARCGSSSSSTTAYRQIERLARPGINEALIISQQNLLLFNVAPPTLDLSDAAAPVRTEAVGTLTAIYAGVCFLKGAIAPGLAPLVDCPATGAGVLGADGKVTSNATFMTAATTFASTVAGQFLPDVLRLNTAVTSGYLVDATSLCGGTTGPLLCGGRYLKDPVIDITYAYLLHGKQAVAYLTGASAVSPFIAPISNGVFYNAGPSVLGNGDSTGNPAQGHPATLAAFPYSAGPY